MFKQLTQSESEQAIAASQAAMELMRHKTSSPQVGMAAAATLLGAFAHVLGVSRAEMAELAGRHYDTCVMAATASRPGKD